MSESFWIVSKLCPHYFFTLTYFLQILQHLSHFWPRIRQSCFNLQVWWHFLRTFSTLSLIPVQSSSILTSDLVSLDLYPCINSAFLWPHIHSSASLSLPASSWVDRTVSLDIIHPPFQGKHCKRHYEKQVFVISSKWKWWVSERGLCIGICTGPNKCLLPLGFNTHCEWWESQTGIWDNQTF